MWGCNISNAQVKPAAVIAYLVATLKLSLSSTLLLLLLCPLRCQHRSLRFASFHFSRVFRCGT